MSEGNGGEAPVEVERTVLVGALSFFMLARGSRLEVSVAGFVPPELRGQAADHLQQHVAKLRASASRIVLPGLPS